jgi:hypothetical protein
MSEHAELLAQMEARGARLTQIRLPSEREGRLRREIERVKETSRHIAHDADADTTEVHFSDGSAAEFVVEHEQPTKAA